MTTDARAPMAGRISGYIRNNVLGLVAIYLALSGAAIAAIPDNDSVLSQHIVDGEVKNADLGSSSVTSSKLGLNAIPGDGIVVGEGSTKIAAGAVATNEIRNGTVAATDIATGAVEDAELSPNSIVANGATAEDGSTKVAIDAISSEEIQGNAVGSGEIATDSVASAEVAPSSLTGNEVTDGSLLTGDILNGTILSADFAPSSVNSSAIAGSAVTSSKIADQTIAAIDIGANGVGASEIDSSQVQRRVGGTCPAGQAIRTVGSTGSVSCAPTGSATALYTADANPGTICNDFCVDGSLALPAGLYMVAARITITEVNDAYATCKLHVGSQIYDQVVVRSSEIDDAISGPQLPAYLQGIVNLGAPANLNLSCRDSDLTDSNGASLSMIATTLGNATFDAP